MIHTGDMLTILPTLDADSFAACVTDPPYELGFMGKAWDRSGIAFQPETWAAVYRVLKPGAYLLAFGGTRTYHRITCAIEDAGFEVKDCLMWLHGQGFPKHKSLLKPAWEPIILAKKRGPGVLNVDACRIETIESWPGDARPSSSANGFGPGDADGWNGNWTKRSESHQAGRWPANVILDETSAAALDAMTGVSKSTAHTRGLQHTGRHGGLADLGPSLRDGTAGVRGHNDTGGASRFFYVAKASRSERNAGLGGLPEKMLRWSAGDQNPGSFQSEGTNKHAANHHPCVKPVALMRWLVRLVTPPGGTILDPFTGSGSTGIAAALEGFAFTGIERDPEYVEIARRRIAHAAGPLLAMAV